MTGLDRKELERWAALADKGITVSICHGPTMGRQESTWTVQLLYPDGTWSKLPFEGRDFDHCIEIAEIEATLWEANREALREPAKPTGERED